MMKSKSLLFAAYHFYLDPSNGAAITTREILSALAARGWEVRTFCGCGLDFQKPEAILQILADRGIKPERYVKNRGETPFVFSRFRDGPIRSSLFLPDENRHIPSEEAGFCYLQLLREIIGRFEPGVFITYGGYWLGKLILELSRERHVKNVLLLQNLAYEDPSYFENVDLCLVPSRFASEYYAKKLGIASTPIAPMMDWNAFRCDPDELSRQYVTFVNPEPGKGGYLFARVAEQLWKRRPDIPLLVVEGRAGVDWLGQTGVDLRGLRNMSRMANTPDPRDFYRVSKLVIMPSMFMESFGRIAAEAMINGIPVIGSNRGALPEVIGDAGLILDIPKQYTPESRTGPTPEEVEPWVQAILKLREEAEFYEEMCLKAQARAESWRPESIAEQYDSALSELL